MCYRLTSVSGSDCKFGSRKYKIVDQVLIEKKRKLEIITSYNLD